MGERQRRTRRDLFDSWQAEAQACQAMMDDDQVVVDEESYAYWRGRRDGFEGAAYDLGVELGVIPRPPTMLVSIIT